VYQLELAKALRENNFNKAIEISKRQLKGNDFDFDPYSMISKCYYSLGNYKEAIENAKKALSCEKDYQPAIQIIVLSNDKIGNIREAYNYANQSIELYEKNPPKLDKNEMVIVKVVGRIINILSAIPKFKRFKVNPENLIKFEFDEMNKFYDWAVRYVLRCKQEYPWAKNE
jgi:tetratricopeptide (TPR) repeat protein